MILILSEEIDISTNEVLDWLQAFGMPYIKLNDTASIEILEWEIKNGKFRFLLKANDAGRAYFIDSEKIKFFWYRRGCFVLKDKMMNPLGNDIIAEKMRSFKEDNNKEITDFLHFFFEKKVKSVGAFHTNFTNKYFLSTKNA